MVQACVDHWTGAKIRECMPKSTNGTIRLQELDFRPARQKSVMEEMRHSGWGWIF